MIEFKIVACPDRTQQSTYRHSGNEMIFGSSEGQMVVDDPAICAAQIRIFWQGSAFYLENLDPQVEVRLNGKPFEGAVPMKERDNVNMGRTTINFAVLNLKPIQPPAQYSHPQADARFIPGSKEKGILDSLDFLAKPEAGAKPPIPPGMPKPPLPPGAMPPPLPPTRKS